MRVPKAERTPIFRFLEIAVVPLMSRIARYRVRGAENIPREGAFVLSPNHVSNLDPIVMGVALWKAGRAPRFLAKASLFRIPVVGAILRSSGQVPVERGAVRRGGASDPMKGAGDIARKGLAVIIYPEGTLTREPDLWPMRGKTGAVRAALEQGIPLIPAAHWGVQRILPRYAKRPSLFPRSTVDIVFGEPLDLSAYRDRPIDPALLREATEELMTAITRLLEGLRDETAPPERWDPAKNGQTETGRL